MYLVIPKLLLGSKDDNLINILPIKRDEDSEELVPNGIRTLIQGSSC